MAEFESTLKMNFEVTLTMTEEEAEAFSILIERYLSPGSDTSYFFNCEPGAISLANTFREKVDHNIELIRKIQRGFNGDIAKGGSNER